MPFHAVLRNKQVFLVPQSLDVPTSVRGAVVPVVVLGGWKDLPEEGHSAVPEAPVPPPAVAVLDTIPPPPAEAPAAPAAPAPAPEPAPVKASAPERRK